MKFRVWHKIYKEFMDLTKNNIYVNDTKVVEICLPTENWSVYDNQYIEYEIGKDVEIDWGFEYEGKKYFENDKVNFEYEGKIMQNFIVVFQNDGSFAMRRIIGHKVFFHYFNSLNKNIVAFGNTRQTIELMEGL